MNRVLDMLQVPYRRHRVSANRSDLAGIGMQYLSYLLLYLHPDGFNFRHASRVKDVRSTPSHRSQKSPIAFVDILRGKASQDVTFAFRQIHPIIEQDYFMSSVDRVKPTMSFPKNIEPVAVFVISIVIVVHSEPLDKLFPCVDVRQ